MRLPCVHALQSGALALLLAVPMGLHAQRETRPAIGPELPPEMQAQRREKQTEAAHEEFKQSARSPIQAGRVARDGGALDNSADANVAAGTVLGANIRPGVMVEPSLIFETTFVELGDMEEGSKATARFPFTNTSDRTITITNTQTSCGCTVASLEKKVFAPGEGDVVEINFDSVNRPGLNDRLVRVVTDEPGITNYALRLRANVIQEVSLSQRVAAFGEVPVGESRSVTINVLSIVDGPFEVLEVVNARGDVQVEMADPKPYSVAGRPETGVQIPITITLPADRPAGRVSGNVVVRTNQPGRNENLSVIYTGNVVGAVTYSPARLYFGVVPPNSRQMTRGSLSVTNGEGTFELESWEVLPLMMANGARNVTDPEKLPKINVSVSKPAEGTGMQSLMAVADIGAHLEHLQGKLALTGRIGDKTETIEIPFAAYVRDTPALQQQQQVPGGRDLSQQGASQRRPAPVVPGS